MSQLSQVQLAVAASPPGPDCDSLISLQSDIEELISLTRENLMNIQKQVKERGLPAQAGDVSHFDNGSSAQTGTADHFDKEYALLKVRQRCGALHQTVCPETRENENFYICHLYVFSWVEIEHVACTPF
jgi:hypothetical protein